MGTTMTFSPAAISFPVTAPGSVMWASTTSDAFSEAANVTANISDDTSGGAITLVSLASYANETQLVFPGAGELPPGAKPPKPAKITVAVEMGESNGVTPLTVTSGEYIEATVQFAPIAATPNTSTATLVVQATNGSTASISIVATVGKITMTVPPVSVELGKFANVNVTVTGVAGAKTTVNLTLNPEDSTIPNVLAAVDPWTFSIEKGQTVTTKLTVFAPANLTAPEMLSWTLSLSGFDNGYGVSVLVPIKVTAPPVVPAPNPPGFYGTVYKITNPEAFFLGLPEPPSNSYEPWPGLTVTAWFWYMPNEILQATLKGSTDAKGRFGIPVSSKLASMGTPSADPLRAGIAVLMTVFADSGGNIPLWRSQSFSIAQGEMTKLQIYALPITVPTANGITAGNVSALFAGQGLPSNTTCTAFPGAVYSFSGSEDGASIIFTAILAPWQIAPLDDYIIINLGYTRITVGFPADIEVTPEDLLQNLQNGLATASGTINSQIPGALTTAVVKAGIPSALAGALLAETVTSIMTVTCPQVHTWNLTNTTDPTVIAVLSPCIGYPIWPTNPVWPE